MMSSQASRLVVERHATPVRLGDQSLTRQDCTKYLGVLVDRHLQWDQQCLSVKKKINFGTCLINRAKDGLPEEMRVNLYRAFIEPHIDFCAPVWSATTETNVKLIESAQRNTLKAMADYCKAESMDQLFAKWDIEKVRSRWRRLDAQWLYKLRNLDKFPKVPDYLRTMLAVRTPIREPRTRKAAQKSNINALVKTEGGKRLFCFRLWKSDLELPKEVWNSSSLFMFQKAFLLAS